MTSSLKKFCSFVRILLEGIYEVTLLNSRMLHHVLCVEPYSFLVSISIQLLTHLIGSKQTTHIPCSLKIRVLEPSYFGKTRKLYTLAENMIDHNYCTCLHPKCFDLLDYYISWCLSHFCAIIL